MKLAVSAACAILAFAPPPPDAGAQEVVAGEEAPAAAEPEPPTRRFRIGGEVKVHFRDSEPEELRLNFPFPPSFIPPGQPAVFARTVAAGKSFELSTATLIAEGDLGGGVAAKVEVRFSDLYNRNPTSSDDRVFVRQGWVRLGDKYESLQPQPGTSFYVLVGLAPRFTKQLVRRMESYGLWGTAVGRFEQPQLEAGGSLGRNVYWRGMIGNGNPVFFRDVNALAGDNGTPERVPGDVHPIHESGFPILYDAKPGDINFQDRFELGGGLGVRFGDERRALDLLGWYFERQMEDAARIRGTFYEGDLDLLRGAGVALPFSGDEKRELGVNLEGRIAGLRLFAQYVDQEIAELPRSGFEIEAAYVISLNGLFAYKDASVGNWIQPVVRYSEITNDWDTPREFPGQSVGWDWEKWDFGIRFGIVTGVDLTAEYALVKGIGRTRTFRPDELLVTLRAAF